MGSVLQKRFLLPVVCLLALPSLVQAGEGLRFLPPSGCLPADGGPPVAVHVHVWGAGAEGGELSVGTKRGRFSPPVRVDRGFYRLDFQPPRLKKGRKTTFIGTLKSGDQVITGTLDVPLCPRPTGRVEVRAEPDKLLAGEGQQAFLHIRVTDPEGGPWEGLPLEITTNVGEIKLLRDLGGGEYKAVFHPPGDPFPQVAIIMVANPTGARLDRVAVGRAVIPITARVELPGKTASRTQMEMVVAGRKFGPVRADRAGKFSLPILVPPGYGTGLATSVDRVGNRKSRTVPLFLPETNQLGLWGYPRTLPADGSSLSRLLVTTIDPFGKPTDIGGVRITAGHGKVGAVKDIGKGIYEAYYVAPAAVGNGEDTLVVVFPKGGKKSRADLGIRLLPGPADRVTVEVPALLAADGRSTGRVIALVRDARDNPVGGQQVTFEATVGTFSAPRETSLGHHESILTAPPDPAKWTSEIRAIVLDRGGTEPARLMVAPDSLKTEAGGHHLETVLVDRTGRPTGGVEVRMTAGGQTFAVVTTAFGRARFGLFAGGEEGPRSCRLSAGERIEREVFWVEEGENIRLLPLDLDPALPPDAPLVESGQVRLHPAAPVELVLEAQPPGSAGKPWRIQARIVGPEGDPGRREVKFSASAGALGAVKRMSTSEFEVTLDPGAGGWGRILVSAVEAESHVGAVLEIREPGSGDPPVRGSRP